MPLMFDPDPAGGHACAREQRHRRGGGGGEDGRGGSGDSGDSDVGHADNQEVTRGTKQRTSQNIHTHKHTPTTKCVSHVLDK